MSSRVSRLIIMGAAGRDFHDFNVYWRQRDDVEVVCFTATQIPNIAGRTYPAALAGPRYPNGIPIYPESQLESLIQQHRVDQVTLAYSDVSYDYVMHQASRVHAAGADFLLLAPTHTMLSSSKPVIAVCAARTGCGKSQTARRITRILAARGKRAAVVRHPMPYGDLTRQICQRFAATADMDAALCTIEEREEYEPHIQAGNVVFAGVDYQQILHAAQREADVILWDGGNNDLPFFRPNLHVTVVDPHRPGHELRYFPGETNLRMAHVVVINKVDTAAPADVEAVERNVRHRNPAARLVRADSLVSVDDSHRIRGQRVLVVEDGPTLTHGEMPYGAGHVAADRFGAASIVDPRPYASGSLREVFEKYAHLHDILPAVGYGDAQVADLEATINRIPCDLVLIGTPIDLGRMLKINKPALRVRYELREHDPRVLEDTVAACLSQSM
ncbi:MAG: hypothetical protein CHACPFDD_03644 [Phycisphaerae bacterium]|nr:hypothetical protein [Phycisphaerae bacterium]